MRVPARRLRRLCAVALLALLAACADGYVAIANQEDFQSFEHPFTDEAEARVRRVAERNCGARNLVPVRHSRNCSLSKCFTTFQCVDKETAATVPAAPPAAATR